MIQFIEFDNRVFSYEVTPDTPGWCRRTFTLKVESGPPLTMAEYERVSAFLVAEIEAAGNVVRSWSAIR